MKSTSSGKKVANGLVAAGTAAVLAVYAAGYERTRSAASQLEAQSDQRRPAASRARGPAPVEAAAPASLSAVAAPSAIPASAHEEHAAVPVQIATLERAPSVMAPTPSTPTTPAPAVAPADTPAPAPVAPAPQAAPPPAPVATVATVTPPVAAPAPAPPAAPQPAAKWKDGTYTGWGTCRHGDIQSEVIVADGRITSAKIVQCLTRYSCDIIGRLPPQVLQRQSPEVDYVSGATQSANAFYYSLVDALSKAK